MHCNINNISYLSLLQQHQEAVMIHCPKILLPLITVSEESASKSQWMESVLSPLRWLELIKSQDHDIKGNYFVTIISRFKFTKIFFIGLMSFD